ncbi:hypothetical protein BOX15_Mlig021975g3 [Macrostomum lignano]|uniref:AMP-binding domain-containing protein n=1 Tax=Macrostomum lignano TaxID=282301 RepID=A0A267DII0_9PLAT|nr:hypothetical protein BOX15_Mlig021975g3 [Macrostomum lignano]
MPIPKLTQSYCHGSTEEPLQFWRSFDRLPKWASETPNKEMIVFRRPDAPRQSITFADFHRVADGIACRIVQDQPELGAGSLVMVLGTNCLEFCATLAGLHKAGLVIVSAHPSQQSDLIRLADGTDCKALFYMNSGIYKTGAEWLVDKFAVRIDFDSLVQRGKETADKLDDELRKLLRDRQSVISADQTAVIYLTSGTTGKPKMVPHSHHSLVNSIRFRTRGALLNSEDIFFSDRPTSHVVGTFGFLMAILDGLTLVATPANTFAGNRGAENAVWLLDTLAEEQVTSGDFFGHLVHDILQKGGKPPATLRSALLSGAPTTSEQMERAMTVLPCLVNYYGSTETLMISEICPPWGPDNNPTIRQNTVGRAAPHMEVMIADPDRGSWLPLPIGTDGEVLVRGFSVMRGYLDDPELIRAALTDSGWYRTGDIGSMDEFGNITVTNRIKDLIILATEKVAPTSVERVLLGHPEVHAAQVFGVPDERVGEEIAACVILKTAYNKLRSPEETSGMLARWCIDQSIGESRSGVSYVPRYWAVLDHFPTGPTGKVTKTGLREYVASGNVLFDGVEFLPSGR